MRIFVILAILALSCSNPKERIVERQKLLQKRIDSLETSWMTKEVAITDSFFKTHDIKGDSAVEEVFNFRSYRDDLEYASKSLISPLKKEFDSLEMELKKY